MKTLQFNGFGTPNIGAIMGATYHSRHEKREKAQQIPQLPVLPIYRSSQTDMLQLSKPQVGCQPFTPIKFSGGDVFDLAVDALGGQCVVGNDKTGNTLK